MSIMPVLPVESVAPADIESDDNQYHLLVIEDNSDIAAYIGQQFCNRYTISYATNGREGLEKAQELVPDLIITDLMMPVMDGLEVCRQVRCNEIINHIPIIVVTAKISEEERIQGIATGADAYIAKPFNADELRAQVDALLSNRRMLRTKFAQVMIEQKETVEPDVANLNAAELRFLTKVGDVIYTQLSNNKEVSVDFVASSVGMNNRQFYSKLMALTDYTPTAYIQRIKIKKAKSILDSNVQISLNEVASQCGFALYPNFVRAFKNVCGITPTDYRKLHNRQ